MMEREASAERPGVSMLKRFIPFLIVAAVAVPARAQGRGGQPPQAPPAAGESAGPREEFAGAAEEKISQTSHTIRVDGREIKYTATAGTLPIRLDNGQVVARMFFVAYTKDGEDAKTRPVSFLYNGGPGAATIWLHMGSFAPKHVRMADEGFQPRRLTRWRTTRTRWSTSAISCSSTRFPPATAARRRATARSSSTDSRATCARSVSSSTSTSRPTTVGRRRSI